MRKYVYSSIIIIAAYRKSLHPGKVYIIYNVPSDLLRPRAGPVRVNQRSNVYQLGFHLKVVRVSSRRRTSVNYQNCRERR